MKCQNCGKELKTEYVACPFCGEKVLIDETESMPFIIGGRFKFGLRDSERNNSNSSKLIWDIVNVNKEQDYAELICSTIVDIRKVNDFKIEFNEIYKSDLYEYLNGTFLFKTFNEDERKVLKTYSKDDEYNKNEKVYVVLPKLDYIIDNELTRIKIDNSVKAKEVGAKLKKQCDSFFVLSNDENEENDLDLWLFYFGIVKHDKTNEESEFDLNDYSTFPIDIEDYCGIRPMIKISISKMNELLKNYTTTYIPRKDVIKSINEEISKVIREYDIEAEHSHEWSMENIPGYAENTDGYKSPTKEEHMKHLSSLDYFDHVINNYFNKKEN